MKRSILLLIPLMLGFIACGGSSRVSNKETVVKMKELLNKQDLSEFYSKTLKGVYSQEYDVLDINYDNFDISDTDYQENEKVSSYFNYSGTGLFGYYYDLSSDEYDSIVDAKGNISTFDAISKGEGYFGFTQVIRTMSFSRENSSEAKINNLDISQSLNLKTTEQDVWLDNTLFVSDDGIFQYETRQELSSSIDKQLLFGSISTRTFREIFSKVDLFDTLGSVEHLDKLYISMCRELTSKSDKEISDFILDNQIFIKEEEDIEVNFVYANEDLEEEEADYIFPGAIKGTLTFDKETYQFTNFSYEMAYQIETYDENTGSVKLININFACSGESSRELPHDLWEPTDPTVYEDVAEYLKDVNEQVIPPNIQL